MNEKQNFNKDEITLEFLEAKLRSIGEPKAPVTLKERLIDDIPRKSKRVYSVFFLHQRFGIWGFGASAAIVMILIVITIFNFGPSTPSSGSNNNFNNYPNNIFEIESSLPLTGSNDVWDNYPNDLDAPFIEDINLAAYYKTHWDIEIASVILSK
ncbi:MAG: hypothetical protein JXA96_05355 [Sedimentisphaerales bacterium]|nr:hypothetical protein [Sedimentisphaerales bacterium]